MSPSVMEKDTPALCARKVVPSASNFPIAGTVSAGTGGLVVAARTVVVGITTISDNPP
jgi:hypothetical protein